MFQANHIIVLLVLETKWSYMQTIHITATQEQDRRRSSAVKLIYTQIYARKQLCNWVSVSYNPVSETMFQRKMVALVFAKAY